jgi:imidazolonepropionase-like amidohydrolase
MDAMVNYLISDGSLLDCTGAETKKNASIFVKDERIAKVGSVAEVKSFADSRGGAYEVIDANGHTIMPGIVDCHVHPSYGDITSFEELDFYPGVEYRTLRGTLALKRCYGLASPALRRPVVFGISMWRYVTRLMRA